MMINNLLRRALIAPQVHEFLEHAEGAAVLRFPQATKLRELRVRHPHILLVGLRNLAVG